MSALLRYLPTLGIIIAASIVAFLVFDRFEQKGQADDAKACAAAADTPEEPLTPCAPAIRVAVIEARKAAVCDAALTPQLRPSSRFAAMNSCGGGTKRLIAESDQLRADAEVAFAEADRVRKQAGDAVARAEQRASQTQKRNDDAQQIIKAAPRDADGSSVCDADCLRRIAG